MIAIMGLVVIVMKVKCGICGFESNEDIHGRRYWDWVHHGAMPTLWICDIHRNEWFNPVQESIS